MRYKVGPVADDESSLREKLSPPSRLSREVHDIAHRVHGDSRFLSAKP